MAGVMAICAYCKIKFNGYSMRLIAGNIAVCIFIIMGVAWYPHQGAHIKFYCNTQSGSNLNAFHTLNAAIIF